MPKRACLDCGALSDESRCPDHRVGHTGGPKTPTPGRGSGTQAARFRREVFAMWGSACVLCGSTANVQAHHVQPLGYGGANVPWNGRPICAQCHPAVEAAAREHYGTEAA